MLTRLRFERAAWQYKELLDVHHGAGQVGRQLAVGTAQPLSFSLPSVCKALQGVLVALRFLECG